MEEALQMHYQLSTSLVRAVDRVSHKLLLKFTLGIDTKVIHVIHNEENGNENCAQNDTGSIDMDTGLNDVLSDFEEITNTLHDDIDIDNNEFDDFTGSLLIDRVNFNVDELFKDKISADLNELSGKSMTNDIGDIVYRSFKGKGKSRVRQSIYRESNCFKGKPNPKGKGKFAVKKLIDNDSNEARVFEGKGTFYEKESIVSDSNADRTFQGQGKNNDIGDIVYRAFKGKGKSRDEQSIYRESNYFKGKANPKGKGKFVVKKLVNNDSTEARAFEGEGTFFENESIVCDSNADRTFEGQGKNNDVGDIVYLAFKGKGKSHVEQSIYRESNSFKGKSALKGETTSQGKGKFAVKKSIDNDCNEARAIEGKGTFFGKESIVSDSNTDRTFQGQGKNNDIEDIVYRAFKGKGKSRDEQSIYRESNYFKGKANPKGKGKFAVKKLIDNDSTEARAFEEKGTFFENESIVCDINADRTFEGQGKNNDAGDIVCLTFKGKGKSHVEQSIYRESNSFKGKSALNGEATPQGKGKLAVKKSIDNDNNEASFEGKAKFFGKESIVSDSNADRTFKGQGKNNDIGDIIYLAFKGKDNSPAKTLIDSEIMSVTHFKGKSPVKDYIANESNVETSFEDRNINDDIGDIIYRAFKGKDKSPVKKIDNEINDIIAFEGKGTISGKTYNDIEINNVSTFNGKAESIDGKAMLNDNYVTKGVNGKPFVEISIAAKSNDLGKKVINEDTNSTIPDAEAILNANLNGNFTPDITLNDVSINTNDLNDTDSNLVETINNFILDHDYVDERFLLESGDPEFMKKNPISKKTDEDSLLREILPKMTKKDKMLLLKEIEKTSKEKKKPIKDLSKLKKIINIRAERAKNETDDSTMNDESNSENAEVSKSKPIMVKPELPIDGEKSEMSKEFIKFGSEFHFRVFELSRQEQLEELQKKREGILYVSALYKCVDCAKGFRSVVTHSNHMRVHNRNYGPFECDVCHSRHSSEARRRRHHDTHRLKYCCTQCEFVARTREKAESHFLWHAGRTFTCSYCSEEFGKASTHLSHVRLHHPSACVWCAVCGEAFIGAYGLRIHTRRRHPTVDVPQESQCVCGECNLQFRHPDALRRHATAGCHPALSACAECGDSFDSPATLALHKQLSHPDAQLQCHVCDALFTSPRSLQTHYERAHVQARRRGSAPARAPPGSRVVCELCGKKYPSAAALGYHKRSHTGERPFPCPHCPRAFAVNHSLQAHLRTHTGEKPFQCSQCPRAFRNANNLARHKKNIHLGQRAYARCSLCLKWFSSAGAVKLHVQNVHTTARSAPAHTHE